MHVEYQFKLGSRQWLEIKVEGEVWRQVDSSLFRSRPQLAPLETSLKQLEENFKRVEYRLARDYSSYLLAQRGYSTLQLQRKLERKGVTKETIEEICSDFCRLKYLDDQERAQLLIRQWTAACLGPQRINQKLQQQGLGSYRELVHCVNSDQQQIELIDRLLQSKYGRINLDDFHVRRKVAAALARKGFSLNLILQRLRLENENRE